MEVGESEVMGTVDDDGVGIRDVDTILNDGGREQHIVVVIGEVEHNLLEFLRFHLSMTDGHTGIRDILMYHLGNMSEIADAVVDEIHLSVARHLEVDGIRDNLRSECMYLCLYGIAVGWWCLDDTQVAGSNERELQRTRYRSCRHGESVDI